MIVTFVSGRKVCQEQADKCFVSLAHHFPAQVDECALELWHYGENKPFFEINLSQVIAIE